MSTSTNIDSINYNKTELIKTEIKDTTNYHIMKGVTWINVTGLEQQQEITQLLESFQIHPMVVEDIFSNQQRTKIDYFDDYLFCIVKIKAPDHTTLKFSFIVMKNLVVSVQEEGSDFFAEIERRISNKNSKARQSSAQYLFYLLLDKLVDKQLSLVEQVEQKVDVLEENFIQNQQSLSLTDIYDLKREVIELRKRVVPIRDMLASLLKSDELDKHSIIYFRDIYDHSLRLNDMLDNQKELLTTLLDIYLSSINNKMNQTMKVLTMFAAIFIPLSFIASVYGMNFSNMPELKWHYGYYFALGLMALIGVSLLSWFKHKKWF